MQEMVFHYCFNLHSFNYWKTFRRSTLEYVFPCVNCQLAVFKWAGQAWCAGAESVQCFVLPTLYSFIRSAFIEHLLHARHYSRDYTYYKEKQWITSMICTPASSFHMCGSWDLWKSEVNYLATYSVLSSEANRLFLLWFHIFYISNLLSHGNILEISELWHLHNIPKLCLRWESRDLIFGLENRVTSILYM